MQELETLLTSLYKRGRKPKDREIISIKFDQEFTKSEGRTILHCNCKDWSWFYADLRRIVSLESGLWEFVCDNKLYKETNKSWQSWGVSVNFVNVVEFCSCSLPQFRLLESALIPEEELAKFLVDNIVIEWNSK